MVETGETLCLVLHTIEHLYRTPIGGGKVHMITVDQTLLLIGLVTPLFSLFLYTMTYPVCLFVRLLVISYDPPLPCIMFQARRTHRLYID